MPEFRFLHSSDLHLGKPFGQFDEDVAADLRKARTDLIPTLARAAQENDVGDILLAGDTFDQETPSLRLIRQTIAAMGEWRDLDWWILPGNHDSLTADLIWQTFSENAPANIHVLQSASPVCLRTGVYILPAPCVRRAPGYDLTEEMPDQITPPGAIRIGLAHGGVVNFQPGTPDPETIPPDRAETAKLDYLALGDWHGALAIGARSFYPGAPERDRFKHGGRGTCYLVALREHSAEPLVTPLPIGRYDWRAPVLRMSPGIEPTPELMKLLPERRADWPDTLVKLHISGFATLDERSDLLQQLERIAPEFCHFDWDDTDLKTDYRPDDLDQIAPGGALRIAAQTLKDEAADADLARGERDIADAALTRLYSLVREGR